MIIPKKIGKLPFKFANKSEPQDGYSDLINICVEAILFDWCQFRLCRDPRRKCISGSVMFIKKMLVFYIILDIFSKIYQKNAFFDDFWSFFT